MVDPGNPQGHWLLGRIQKVFLALTRRSELYASEQVVKIMYNQSQSCVNWRYKGDGRNRTQSCSRMFQRAFAHLQMPSVGMGQQRLQDLILVLANLYLNQSCESGSCSSELQRLVILFAVFRF